MTSVKAVAAEADTRISGNPLQRDFGLDILRIVSICGVVAIHVFGHVVGHAPRGSRIWWIAVMIDIAWIWVVPVFVMISGALLLGSRQLADPALFYRRRAVRLVPALIAWNLIYLIGVRLWMRGEDLTLPRVLQVLADGSVFTQLYFLWLIAGLYAVAPLLAAFLRSGSRRRALVAGGTFLSAAIIFYVMPGVLGLFGLSRPIQLNVFTHWMPYVGYFLVGYALRDLRLAGWKLLATGAVTVGLLAATIWQYGRRGSFPLLDAAFPVGYLGVHVALASLGVFVVTLSLCDGLKLERAGKVTVALSNATFGVFLVHLVIFEAIVLTVPAVSAANSLGAAAGAYAVTLAGSFAVSLAASRIPLLRNIF
jgi:surface polysaccharide O-acyltransferase-like enzyme